MAGLELYLFGQPRLERNGTRTEISLHKALALLAYLAVTRQAHSRDALATLLWPENDQSTARANLRRTLYTLNKTVGEGVLSIESDTVGLATQAGLWLDVEVFLQPLRECIPPPPSTDGFSPAFVECLERAAGLYTDDFLAGFTLPDSPAFDEWQFFQTEHLRRSIARALMTLAQAHQVRGEFDSGITYARRWLALDPLHEPAHRALMQLYAASGQQAAALRQYQQCVRLLQDEFGAPPQPETTALYETIRLGRQTPTPVQSPAHPRIRYVQNGNVHLAYLVVGEGPVDLVFVGGFVGHLEALWEEPELAGFFQRLSTLARLIMFDKRGIGLSDRVGYPPTLENTMDDILAVMGAAGSTRAVLMGVSEGGTSAALCAATYPERVAGLVLYGAMAKGTKSDDYPWALTTEQYNLWLDRIVRNWGGPLDVEFYAPSRAQDERLLQWWARSLRSASSPGEIRGVLEVLRDIDVRIALPAVRAPTLVLHRTGDRAVRVGNGRFIAAKIPGAKYVELPGDDHWWWVGDAEGILVEIETFLTGLKEPPPSDQVLATLLALEIVGGEKDALVASRENALSRYRQALQQQVARYRGRTIRAGERWAILFDGPTRALQCASAACRAGAEMGVLVRVGLHTGEVAVNGTGTLANQIALRLMESAAPGQILVSSTLKDLVTGSGFSFDDRGARDWPDIPGTWRLYTLDTVH